MWNCYLVKYGSPGYHVYFYSHCQVLDNLTTIALLHFVQFGAFRKVHVCNGAV